MIVESKKKREILPLCDPILNAWPDECFLASIVQNTKYGYDWFMNTFIQIKGYILDGNYFRICFYPNSEHHLKANIYDFCPFIEKSSLYFNVVDHLFGGIIEFITYFIEKKYYISIYLDQFFREEADNREGFYHPNYICGYDLVEKKIFVTDNFNHGKYDLREISFEKIEKAYALTKNNSKKPHMHIINLYYLKDYILEKPVINIKQIIEILDNYISSNAPTSYESEGIENNFGVQCYDLASLHVINIGKSNGKLIDVRSFAFLIDHKKLMYKRIQWLAQNGYLSNEGNLLDGYSEIKKKCDRLLNLSLKFNVSGKVEIIEKICSVILDIKKRDIEITNSLLGELIKNKET